MDVHLHNEIGNFCTSYDHLGTAAEVSNFIMQANIHWPWVSSLEAAILQAFSQTQLDGYVCKDSDDCMQCIEGKDCSQQCGRSQAAKQPQLVDHGHLACPVQTCLQVPQIPLFGNALGGL